MVRIEPGTAVMAHQGEEQWAQDAILGGGGAEGDAAEGVSANPNRLGGDQSDLDLI